MLGGPLPGGDLDLVPVQGTTRRGEDHSLGARLDGRRQHVHRAHDIHRSIERGGIHRTGHAGLGRQVEHHLRSETSHSLG